VSISTPKHPRSDAGQVVWLVAQREMNTKLRSKAFIISTAVLVLIALAGVLWMGFSSKETSTTPVAATADVANVLENIEGLEVTLVADRAAAEVLVRAGDVDAAILADPAHPTGLMIIADTEAPQSLLLMLTVPPSVELLSPDGGTWGMRYLLGLAFGLIFMMAAMSFGTPITTSVVEEKQTRVVEILLSAIPARVLLAGKVIGNTILVMAQIFLLIAAVVVGLTITGQTQFLEVLSAPIVWFVIFFFFGFILLAAMFAAAGALVSRQEDVGPTMTPLIYLTMIPYFLVIFLGENPIAMAIMSYVPFSAPVAMPIRLFFNEALWWEPLLSLGVMLATCVAMVVLGGKIYENSLLKMGARVKFRDALRK
jgi:ABC-2 type transport system permease protein